MSFEDFSASLGRATKGRLANLIAVRTVDSTNRLARRVVEEYAREELTLPRFWVAAYEQKQGRGRQGRSWFSGSGLGVYASLTISLDSQERLETLPLMVATALAQVVEEITQRPCRIKWPNDLVVGGRKIGGILIELVHAGGEGKLLPEAIVGFGVNHGHREHEMPTSRSTSLCVEASSLPDLGKCAAAFLIALDQELARDHDSADVLDRYRRLSIHEHGAPLRCRLPDGTVEGRFLGFNSGGRLRIEVEGKERVIHSGEVMES